MIQRALLLLSITGLLPAALHADDEVRFGRLFMEPKTREQLDESRQQNADSRQLPADEAPEDAEISTLRIDGVLLRRDGSTEIWVNGQRGDSPQLAVRRAAGNRFRVVLPGGGEVTLKPGQVYSFESRRVLEGYEAARELAAERKPAEEVAQLPVAAGIVPAQAQPAAGQPAAPAFNEAELAEQDVHIQLQEEHNPSRQQGNGVGN
jgi:hypothetical protein